jgi:hypothetical protein
MFQLNWKELVCLQRLAASVNKHILLLTSGKYEAKVEENVSSVKGGEDEAREKFTSLVIKHWVPHNE